MPRVILDPITLAKLRQPGGRVEVWDESGRVVGVFLSLLDRSLFDEVEVPFTAEELGRFEREAGGRTLDEILADLEGRSSGGEGSAWSLG